MYGFEYPTSYILQCEFWHSLAGLLFGAPFLISITLLTERGVRHIFRSRLFLAFSLLALAFMSSLSHYLADTLAWGF